jgi:hypothetical protein
VEGFTVTNGFTPFDIRMSSGSVGSCVFVANIGIYGGGMEVWSSSLTVENCVFDSNTPGGDGAISVYSSDITVDACEFVDNQTFEGASAIWIGGGSTLTVANSRFERNFASEGGAVLSISSLPIVVEDCEFVDNETNASGGAIGAVGDLTVRRCLFQGNMAPQGGAIVAGHDTYGFLIEDSVFHANEAEVHGGAILGYGSGTLSRSTLVANRAGNYGAGVASKVGASISIDHSVIAFATLGGGVYCDGESSVSASCSDVFGNLGGDWVGCIGPQLTGGNFHVDPLFCDVLGGDFTVAANSVLLAANNPCGVAIGALGQGCASQVTAVAGDLPAAVQLGRPWPNPFNPRTTLSFSLPSASPVRLAAYDARGREVSVLVNDFLPAGEHEAVFEAVDPRGRRLASGVYFARLETVQSILTTRLVLVR